MAELESRTQHRDRLLRVLSDYIPRTAPQLPGHRRRTYSILSELTRAGYLTESLTNGLSTWQISMAVTWTADGRASLGNTDQGGT